jgi:hypothetical protein
LPTDSELRQISQMIQERRFDEARAALQTYLKSNPDSDQGWYLLSFTAKTPADRQDAIRRAMQIAPNNDKYKARLAKIADVPAKSSSRLPLILAGVVIIGVIVVIVVALSGSSTPTDNTLPTVAVVNNPTSDNAAPTTAAATLESAAPIATPTDAPPPAEPTMTATFGTDAGVALDTPLDIGTGEMRVITATRPGDSLISELGGMAIAPSPNHEWLVVELSVDCSGDSNCAPSLTTIRVTSASGGVYPPALDFSVPAMFGPGAYSNGQVYGYLGFLVPTSDESLRLIFSWDGAAYTFALE